MRLLIGILVILVALFIVWAMYQVIREGSAGLTKYLKKRERTHGKWEIAEEKGEDGLEVYIVEPGTDRKQLVEATDQFGNLLSCARWGGDFDFELEILRTAAAQRITALNDRSLIR